MALNARLRKLFVDWAGQGIDILDRDTGKVAAALAFVRSRGASSFTYAEAMRSQVSAC